MARKKVKLAWIANDSSRKATYKKRKKGLIKKVCELSTLCDVNACAVVYGPGERQPDVWPWAGNAQHVVMRFKSLPEMEQSKKMMNQEAFLSQRMAKLNDQLKKQQREIRQLEVTMLLHQCLSGKGLQEASVNDLSELMWVIESEMKKVQERVEFIQQEKGKRMLKMKEEEEGRTTTALEEVVAMEMEALQKQQWFMDVLNQQDHMVWCWEEMTQPFGDCNPWLDGPYP
ncbi:hypothetical protein MRB53_033948 [Persea americana]|uniref:Uncharacterized protein n=1 Tax=Persea americana TaxID=3435 RepID=A0ACC2KWR6_PERAE|nr:hypothetical protein MRB53_033948 [Persea americana]